MSFKKALKDWSDNTNSRFATREEERRYFYEMGGKLLMGSEISEMKEEKVKLEEVILTAISKFEGKYGVTITDIDLGHNNCFGGAQRTVRVRTDVRL